MSNNKENNKEKDRDTRTGVTYGEEIETQLLPNPYRMRNRKGIVIHKR